MLLFRRMTKALTDELASADLAQVVGGNAWDKLDNGVAKVVPGWKSYSCPVRTSWVGLGIGSVMEAGKWAAVGLSGPAAPATMAAIGGGVGLLQGVVGTAAATSYMANCDRHKAAGTQ